MKKQILSFVILTVLPLAFHVTAAPTSTPGSTEEADRQFLQNLEKSDAAKTRAATATPKPASQPATAQTKVIVRRPNTIVLSDDYEEAPPPDEVADDAAEPAEAPVTHVTVTRPTRVVREHHHVDHHPLHHLLRRLLSFHPEDW